MPDAKDAARLEARCFSRCYCESSAIARGARAWHALAAMSERIPFTILTGFLGAGKTTALNRLLGARVPRRVAVLVNDLGRVNVDRQLIAARHGDILELSGGCVCCAVNVQRDLWAGILDLLERAAPEHLVLETTGIAEPHLILDRLGELGGPRERVLAAGVVCVVDGEVGAQTLATRSEARAQVTYAERLLLSKLDRATAVAAGETHAAIRTLNDDGELASFPPGDLAATSALATWLLEVRPLRCAATRWIERARDENELAGDDEEEARAGEPSAEPLVRVSTIRASPSPSRHGQLEVVTFTDDAPLRASVVMEVLHGLGDRLVRAKGFVHVAGEARRGFVEKAGALPPSLTLGADWGPGQPRRTELVLIGEALDEPAIVRQLWSARCAPDERAV